MRALCLGPGVILNFILCRCRIQLHRKAHFADLPLNLQSCSFASMERSIRAANKSEKDNYESIESIMEASQNIVDLVAMEVNHNTSANSSSREHWEVPLSEPHWPYFGCCQMVASYGSLLAILASSHNDQWKKKAAESGLELMDTALDNLASVWPIVDLFRSEIRSCRELMGTLPHGID